MIEFEIPIRTKSEANQREHWAVKAKRVKQHREATAWVWRAIRNTIRTAIVQEIDGNGIEVAMTRVAPRELDDDNLVGSFKAIRDQLAEEWSVNDRHTGITWKYGQRKGSAKQYTVTVRIARKTVTP